MNKQSIIILCITILILISPKAVVVAQTSDYDNEDAWDNILNLAEGLLGTEGVLRQDTAMSRIEALIDLHAQFSSDVLGKPVTSERVVVTKQAFRLFLDTLPYRYSGDKRIAILRLLRDLAANRAFFIEIFSSTDPAEVIQEQIFAYLERNAGMSYTEPVSIPHQVSVPYSDIPIRIVPEGIVLVADEGTSGHYNNAVDAGETITINVPLRNTSNVPFRSTSGFLQSKDPFVVIGNSEVVYTEKSVVDGETITFAPDSIITPSMNYTFTILQNCPDEYELPLEILVWDSDQGKFTAPFTLKVYNVGPLDFGTAQIDDDMPGPSRGNDNSVIEPGETIEYVLAVQNKGVVQVDEVTATLFSPQDSIQFTSGDDVLRYREIPARSERPIPANFTFKISGDKSTSSNNISLRLFAQGKARGFDYSWLRTQVHSIGVSDDYWESTFQWAKSFVAKGKYYDIILLLSEERLAYRIENSSDAQALLSEAQRQHRSIEQELQDQLEQERLAALERARQEAQEEERKRQEVERQHQVAERQRIDAERLEEIRDTPIATFKINFAYRDWFGDRIRYLGAPQAWRTSFKDKNGENHDVKVTVRTEGSNFGGSEPDPIFSLTVDGTTVTQNMDGRGAWMDACSIRIDPILCVFFVQGITLFRTDYGFASNELSERQLEVSKTSGEWWYRKSIPNNRHSSID